MENSSKENELVKGIKRLMEKSIEANTQIMSETTKTFSSFIKKSPELSDLQKLNAKVLSNNLSNFMELNLKYAESLIDLGVQLSNDLSSFVENLNKKESEKADASNTFKASTQTQQTPPTPRDAPKATEFRLSGKAGDSVKATFVLNSSANVEQNGTFKATRCKNQATGKFTNIFIKFSPSTFKILPGEEVEIEVSTNLPKSAKVGTYHSDVIINGLDNTQFGVMVYVEEKAKPKK